MTGKVFFLIAALCLAQVAYGAEKPAEQVDFNKIIENAQNALGNMATEVQKALGVKELPDPQQVAKTLMDQSQVLATKVGTIVTDLQKEISANPDINTAITAIAKKFNETVADLQKQAPAMQAKATEVQQQLQTAMQALVTESQKLGTTLSKDMNGVSADLSKIAKSTLDQVIKTATDVQEQVKKAIQTPSANV